MIKTTKFGSLGFPFMFLVLLILLAIVILYFEILIVTPGNALLLDEGNLTDAQSTGIGYVAGLGELMINWSVAIIGAIALLAKGIPNQRGLERLFSGFSLVLAFLSCIISIWLGMLVLDLTIDSLTWNQNPLDNDSLRFCRRWQYLSFLCALVLFIFSRTISIFYTPGEKENEK